MAEGKLEVDVLLSGGTPMRLSANLPADVIDPAGHLLIGVERLDVYFDAGTRVSNPGPSGIAFYAEVSWSDDPYFVYHLRVTELVGEQTNNAAEWLGLVRVLEYMVEYAPDLRELAIRSDSHLVVRQALGEWRARGALIVLRNRAWELAEELDSRGCRVTIEHVSREQNTEADRLVTDMLDRHLGCRRGY